ncbi:MAG TPA: PD-(D/E)XK nuclease family protein [Pyrinomonadaceae bacterium]|nr:PD-(D/E)XK nuclease family protein [Pyrinomonadaceae bacterium]
MSKQIWLGPVRGNNRDRLLARCREYIARGETDRLLYIAASHPLLDLVTEKLLDGKAAQGVWGEFPIYLFRGLVRRILSEARPLGRAPNPTEPLLTRGLLTQPTRTPIDREELPLRHSLVSQIIKQLSSAGKLTAIRPLAYRDGCVNTVASLLGEIQRAGKSPDEFREAIESREAEASSTSKVQSPKYPDQKPKSQIDFDRDVAQIYSTYAAALDKFNLTDEDADQLQALQVVRGDFHDHLSWLSEIDLVVLDGFFDFTPVQGEILKYIIPLVPSVIVNVNHDDRNEEIFRPFQSTIEHLQSIAPFEIVTDAEAPRQHDLRARLFNVDDRGSSPTVREGLSDWQDAGAPQAGMPAFRLFECADRELEIRSIAKEIKRLVLTDDYNLSDIALIVRERASYADTIARVFADESVPCNLERRVEAEDVPAIRACDKLFQILKEPREHVTNPKTRDIGHLIKTGYFQPSPKALDELAKAFDAKYAALVLTATEAESNAGVRQKFGIGQWRPDDLENVIAYVGSELRVNAWIDRARKLINIFPSQEAARSLFSRDDADDSAVSAADEAPPEDGAVMDRRKKPTPIHPAAIAWGILLMRHLQQAIAAMPEDGTPEALRAALMRLLEQLQFANQINQPFNERAKLSDLPQATLDVRGRESLRRAIAAAVRAFTFAREIVSEARPRGPQPGSPVGVGRLARATQADSASDRELLTHFIDEVETSLRAQVLTLNVANRDGLRVLEATDIRGLRFRAVFIAGMIEGGFPLRASRDWLYPHEERVRLQKQGIFLEDISTDTLLKEEHYFYQTACRATERLYLTRPLTLNDGSETVASYYVEELSRAIAPAQIELKQIRGDVDAHDVLDASKPNELAMALIRQSEQPPRQQNVTRLSQTVVEQLLTRAATEGDISPSARQRVMIERERNGKWFGPYDGEISNADLRRMLARHFGPDHVYSASRLSSYGNCSYRFFASRVLRLEPRTEAALDLQAIDAGKLLHDILRRFFEKHRGEYLPTQSYDALRKDLAATADAVFKEHEDKVPPLNDRIWKIDCEIRKLILDQVLLHELRLQEKTNPRGMRPTYFELAFGRAVTFSDPHSTTNYLKFERETNGAKELALVQGQIDRVDVSQDGETAIAYDYKLSKGARLEDIESGREVQLPIYLAALEQLFLPSFQLAGGGYYTLRAKGSRLNQGLYRAMLADCTLISPQAHKSRLTDEEWQRIRQRVTEHIWNFIDGMRSGHFRVKPALGKTTCKFCDYSAVCRYDAYRISRKK